jgi:hemoglobin/transferrin/lactoferrin receptor protein
MRSRPGPVVLLAVLTLLAAPLEAARYRVVDENGRPAPDVRVSLLGRAGSVAADADGVLALEGEPAPPFELGVFSPSGAWLGLVRVEARAEADTVRELVLPAARSAEVLVSSGTAASLLAPPANAVSLVSRRELDERHPNRLTEAVTGLAGVGASDESTSAVPVVRGLARGRTLLMLDDGRVTAERRAGPSASYLNPFSLENVEVTRGPGSVAYGSDAFGGVVHAKTPMPTPGAFSGRFAFAAGTGGTPETSGGAFVNVPAGPGALSLALYQRSQGDYETPSGTQDNSAAWDRGLVLRGLLPLGGARLFAGFQLDQVRDMGKPQADLPTTRTFYPSENSSRFTLGLDSPGALGFSSFELRGFLGAYGLVTNRQRRANATTTLRNALADVDADDFSLRLLARRAVGAAGLRVGVDVNGRNALRSLNVVETFDAAGTLVASVTEVAVEDANRTDWGAFGEADLPLAGEKLSLSGGVRADAVSTENVGGYFGDRSTSDGAVSGYASVTWTFAPEWKVTAQWARGFRDPTLSDRYYRGVSGRGFVVGNPDLAPETSSQWDLSVRGRYGPAGLGLSGYVYRIDDLIERYRSGEDYRFRNRGAAELAGVELEADVRLAPRLVVHVLGSLSQGKVLDDDTWAPDVLPPTAQLVVDHEPFAGLFWRVRLLAVAGDDRPGASEVAVPGYVRLDVSAGYRLGRHLEATLSVRNLLDAAYADSADENHVTAPGRGALLTLSGSF